MARWGTSSMTNHEFFNGFISPVAHKVLHDAQEHLTLKALGPHLVKATTLYQIYKHNVFVTDGRLPLRDFYQVCGQYLYYDKYVCTHGTEFYYYVIFNEEDSIYQATSDLVLKRIEANAPHTLDDLEYIIGRDGKETI